MKAITKHFPFVETRASLAKRPSANHCASTRAQMAGIFLTALLVGLGCNTAAGSPTFQKLGNGILMNIGKAQVEALAATPTAFCLSVSFDGKPGPAPSIFLAEPPGRVLVRWQLVQSGDFVGVKTAAGELLVNPVTGQWTLQDPSGQTLVPPSDIGKLSQDSNSSQSHVAVAIRWGGNAQPAFYGSGDGMGQKMGTDLPTIIGPETLEQTSVPTHVGNGVAVVPYYWSTAGYSVLAVTGDDNQPASWKTVPDQNSVAWEFPGTTADLYLMPAPNLREASETYDQLTGYPPVPPLWTFGYMQSRWGWTNYDYIKDTLNHFLSLKLPIDALIFDVEWYTPVIDYSIPNTGLASFNDFGWNPVLFPDPVGQIAGYKAKGVHTVVIRKPRLGNSVLLRMMQEKHWQLPDWQSIKNSLASRILNYRDPAVRAWYAQQLKPLLALGIDGWWNDEGEATYTTFIYWNMAEDEAQAEFKPGTRLWTINRAFGPGLQRLGAAAWTGDIEAKWWELERTATDLLNWSLAGMPYCTCDIGGFRDETTPELFTRWMEAGVFYPVMRAHSRVSVRAHFPWLYGQAAEDAMRKALDLRYRLIPYYYSLAYETHTNGVPLMRPLVMEFPKDPKVANLSDQWLMGKGLMAAPIMTTNDQRSVYLPAGHWFVFSSNTRLDGHRTIVATAGLDQIPVYVHEGTILPLGPVIQHTDQLPGGPLELQVYPGRNATFTLSEDDGETTAYQQGEVRRTTFTWDNATGRLSWKVTGPYDGKNIFSRMQIKVFYPEGIRHAEASLRSSGSAQLSPQ